MIENRNKSTHAPGAAAPFTFFNYGFFNTGNFLYEFVNFPSVIDIVPGNKDKSGNKILFLIGYLIFN